ncbi:MAG: 1-acyl-sn-glycerol-3-phosphate acyltransferase [Chloroflexi bacterium]|nr:1-acyl-sn-glycerol-3-phosphate acyltransferase [Chloroflexota bacterium]
MVDMATGTPAIPANRNALAKELIFRALVLPACRSTFDRVWLKVEGPVPHPADGPLIIYMNHPGWWDGYMAFLLDTIVFRRGFESYIMMEEKQLRAYRFFTWCGAFSVDRKRPGEAARSIAYGSHLLRERRDRILWILPQGRIVPNDRRPVTVYPGVARLAQQTRDVLLWPVALRYEFRGEQRPEAFIRAGPAHLVDVAAAEETIVADVRLHLTAAVDALRDDVNDERLERYRTLLRGKAGVNRVWDDVVAFWRQSLRRLPGMPGQPSPPAGNRAPGSQQ